MRRSVARSVAITLVTLGTGCAPPPAGFDFRAAAEVEGLVASSLEFVGDPRLTSSQADRPEVETSRVARFTVAVLPRADCTDCYRLERDGDRFVVRGGVPLGVQYGVAHLLELHGYRFHHPWKTYVPEALLEPDPAAFDRDFAPELSRRRGLHLHTLHPIEALYDFWVPSAKNLEGARRTIDFVVKNRGNAISMYALDDITPGDATADAWKAHTRRILEYARSRGVTTSISIQLFGKSNLQQSFDLIDDDTAPDPLPELERRLHVLLDDVPYDDVTLTFGEFFKADPERLVRSIDDTTDALLRVKPGLELSASIHVGNYPDLRVDFRGERQLYYFLVRYAKAPIVPWVHTVFYYTLYGDAGGAYLHDDFSEHRAYLEARLKQGQRASYFPESAYWVAFDNSVPTYLPVYVKSRWLDLSKLAPQGLEEHMLFSSGWEWGSWQTDAATLRMGFSVPQTWSEPLTEQFAPFGPRGRAAADLIRRLGDLQDEALIGQRLAAYLASRDEVIEVGKARGIVSQPDRVLFSDLVAMTPADRSRFVATVLEPLGRFAEAQGGLDAELSELALPDDNPFFVELKDGFGVTAARGRFIHALYRAVATSAGGADAAPWLAQAEAELSRAETFVSRRRRALWDPDATEVLRAMPNPTFYDYGYLREADTLCFWKRERAQVRNLLKGEGLFVPACVL